ncbi:MAG: hypothetical protein R2725_01565 [Solirubrobacterales bacterium]
MIHHVGIEAAPADLERLVELFELLGFEPAETPATLGEGFTWLQREGTQIHLLHEPMPVAPPRGHLAVVVPDFEATVERLAARSFAVERRRAHWGSPRALVLAPGGHRIELMQAPPTSSSSTRG